MKTPAAIIIAGALIAAAIFLASPRYSVGSTGGKFFIKTNLLTGRSWMSYYNHGWQLIPNAPSFDEEPASHDGEGRSSSR